MIIDLPENNAVKPPEETRQLAVVNRAIPTPHEINVYETMAHQAVTSKMYRGIGEQAGVMMIMLAARELGIPPMQALNGGLNIIQGKVEVSARMMNAMIRKAGHQITVKESTDTHCVLVGKRCDTREIQETSFSLAEATKAGLVKAGGGWTKWPKDMCYARALSRLARQLFPDVIGMGYVEGEISVIEPEIVKHVEEVEVLEDGNQIDELQLYLSKFQESDKELAIQYLEAVKLHFSWSQELAIKNLNNKHNLIDMFNEWKQKRNS